MSCFWALLAVAVPGSAQERAPPDRYRAVLELSAGDMDGPLALTRIDHIVAQGARLFVSQPVEHLIRVLSTDSGELIGELGGPGDGPGELRRITWMGLAADTLTVLDGRLHRITTFDDDGVLTTRPLWLPRLQSRYVWSPRAVTRKGNLVTLQAFIGREEPPHLDPWVLIDPDEGVVLDTMSAHDRRDTYVTLRREGGFSTTFARPIHRGDRWSMATDGSLFVVAGDERGEGVALSVYHTEERRTDILAPGFPPVPVDRRVADSIMGPIREAVQSRGMDEGVARREFEAAMAAPEWLPAADEMFVTAGGEIWLRKPSFSGPYHLWRVMGSDGSLTAEVEVPFGAVLRDRDGDHIWGFRIDPEFRFYTVERYRLQMVNASGR